MARHITVLILFLMPFVLTSGIGEGKPPDVDYSDVLGGGWDRESGITYAFPDQDTSARYNFYDGPEDARIRIIETIINDEDLAAEFFDERDGDQRRSSRGLLDAIFTDGIVEPNGCDLSSSVEGIDGLVNYQFGSSMCLTEDGRFLWVSIAGEWFNPGRNGGTTSHSSASAQIIEAILAEND